MFAQSFARIALAFGYLAVLFSGGFAQEAGSVTFPSATQENRTVRTFETQQQQPQQQLQLPSEMSTKRNDWWPPAGSVGAAPTPEQEVTQPPVQQYSPWIQQPPMPANHYFPGFDFAAAPSMLTGPVGQVRSEHYAYPPEYAEYGHSVVTPAAGNSLGLGPKHLAIVSFIGLLLLFAVIQNSLMAAKRKDALVDALSGRNKRDLYVTRGLRPMTPEQEEILNDDARLRCIQRTVCLENRRIIENLGTSGEKLAKYLTSGVQKSVSTSSGWDRLVEDAGAAGLRGEDCDVLYRDCVLPVTSRSRGNRKK